MVYTDKEFFWKGISIVKVTHNLRTYKAALLGDVFHNNKSQFTKI